MPRLKSTGCPAGVAALLLSFAPLLAPSSARAAPDGPVVLVVNSDDARFSWARVNPVVAKALRVAVVADTDPDATQRRGILTISWRPSRHELAVTYEDERGTISRIMTAPARADDGVDAAVALAVNLVRDQTFELLGPAPAPDPPLPPLLPAAPLPPAAPSADGERAAPPPAVIQAPAAAPSSRSPPQPRFMIALLAGTGGGWASGHGEVFGRQVDPEGVAWAGAAHLAPEVGYFATPRLLLSLQGRLQFVSGASEMRVLDGSPVCGADQVCSPARTALAGSLKATLFAPRSAAPVRSYTSLAVGGGAIRYAVRDNRNFTCGPTNTDVCVDTFTGGPVFVTSGIGLHLRLMGGLDLVAALELAVGVPRATFNLDANLGIAVGF